ncbi:hypothetical protein MMC14_005189 [Varicellaria rhodocarpa]|nr:hypothetical protein [Varicellaria rhodocarpa]
MQHRILPVALLLSTTPVYAQSLDSIIQTSSLGIQEACDSKLEFGLAPACLLDGPPKICQGSVDLIVSSISAQSFPSAEEKNATTNLPHAILDEQNNKATAEKEKKHIGLTLKFFFTLLPQSEQSAPALASPKHHIIRTDPKPKAKASEDEPLANPYNWCHSTLILVQASLATFLIGAISVSVSYSLVAWYAVLNVCRCKLLNLGALECMRHQRR